MNATVFISNLNAQYTSGQNWFTIFGVFFPAMTGICAGINMSSDLLQPAKNIPTGTFSAIGTSVLIYVAFILGLGATCERRALQEDYMIAEKVSAPKTFSILRPRGDYARPNRLEMTGT